MFRFKGSSGAVTMSGGEGARPKIRAIEEPRAASLTCTHRLYLAVEQGNCTAILAAPNKAGVVYRPMEAPMATVDVHP